MAFLSDLAAQEPISASVEPTRKAEKLASGGARTYYAKSQVPLFSPWNLAVPDLGTLTSVRPAGQLLDPRLSVVPLRESLRGRSPTIAAVPGSSSARLGRLRRPIFGLGGACRQPYRRGTRNLAGSGNSRRLDFRSLSGGGRKRFWRASTLSTQLLPGDLLDRDFATRHRATIGFDTQAKSSSGIQSRIGNRRRPRATESHGESRRSPTVDDAAGSTGSQRRANVSPRRQDVSRDQPSRRYVRKQHRTRSQPSASKNAKQLRANLISHAIAVLFSTCDVG